jgi:murein DD-endopeptidase MepM/ murein hydrolase activator NlpD
LWRFIPGKENLLKRKNISILLIEESRSEVRQFSLPSPFLVAILTFFLVAGSALGWIIYDYRSLKPRMADLSRAENLSLHRKEQIAYLTQRIQAIRERLQALDVYDRKLRSIARITTADEGKSLIGVGGSDSRPSPRGEVKLEQEDSMIRSGTDEAQESIISKQKKGGFIDFIKTWTLVPPSTSPHQPDKGWICTEFGSRIAHFKGSREFHKGIDIATRADAEVLAPAGGMITCVDWHKGYGRRVIVAHGLGLVSVFAHLDKVLVARGERIAQGEPIALAGSGGGGAGPYLHYEIHFYGVPVDPRQYMLPTLQ